MRVAAAVFGLNLCFLATIKPLAAEDNFTMESLIETMNPFVQCVSAAVEPQLQSSNNLSGSIARATAASTICSDIYRLMAERARMLTMETGADRRIYVEIINAYKPGAPPDGPTLVSILENEPVDIRARFMTAYASALGIRWNDGVYAQNVP